MIGPLLKLEIESAFQTVRERSTDEELVLLCPECGDKSGNRSVNLKSGLTFCWRCNKGANNKGNFIAWARALGYRFDASNEESSVPIDQLFAQDNMPVKNKMPVFKEVSLPKGFTPIASEPKGVYTRLITRMARRKNLDYADFTEAGAGFTKLDIRWEPFCVFPVIESGKNVYYQGRTYVDVPGETTKKFPSRRECEFGASYWVYNIDAVRRQKPKVVVIVESILNVLSLKRKFRDIGVDDMIPVSVFKHYVSKVQVIKLLRCEGVKEFCLLFDRDAVAQTWKMANSLVARAKLTVAEMPFREENPKLDANDDVDAAWKAIENRQGYTSVSAMAHKLEAEPTALIKQKMDVTALRFGSKKA